MIEVKIEGLQEIEADLLGLPPKIADQTLQAALTMAALPIVNEARQRVPIAHEAYPLYGGGVASPGWLKQRIVRKKVKETNNSAEVIVTIKDKRQAYFWKFIEFGTSKMSAMPFMRPAFETRKSDALDRFVERIKTGIGKAVTKINYLP